MNRTTVIHRFHPRPRIALTLSIALSLLLHQGITPTQLHADPAITPESASAEATAKAPAGAPLSDTEKTDLLGRLDALKTKHPSLSARFTETRVSHLLKEPVKSEGTLAFQTPNKFRREIGGNSPNLTVSDGKVLWLYYPPIQRRPTFHPRAARHV